MLSQYRRRYSIFAAAETWCSSEGDERRWAREWAGSGGVFWASGPRKSDSAPHGYKGRGVAIFFAKELGDIGATGEVVARDPGGRFLAVRCSLHGRPTVVVTAHADNDSDGEQADFYARLQAALPVYDARTD